MKNIQLAPPNYSHNSSNSNLLYVFDTNSLILAIFCQINVIPNKIVTFFFKLILKYREIKLLKKEFFICKEYF